MRKSSLASQIITQGGQDFSNLLQYYQEYLVPSVQPLRKFSFVDLMSGSQGVPELVDVSNIQTVPKDIEFFPSSSPNPQYQKYLNLDHCMPQVEYQRPRRPPTIIIRTPKITSPNMIGTLTYQQRQIKLQKFLQKRKRRTWTKRISYDCRKRVADNRLRVKGRFVTKDQAILMLGIDHELVKKLLENNQLLQFLNRTV